MHKLGDTLVTILLSATGLAPLFYSTHLVNVQLKDKFQKEAQLRDIGNLIYEEHEFFVTGAAITTSNVLDTSATPTAVFTRPHISPTPSYKISGLHTNTETLRSSPHIYVQSLTKHNVQPTFRLEIGGQTHLSTKTFRSSTTLLSSDPPKATLDLNEDHSGSYVRGEINDSVKESLLHPAHQTKISTGIYLHSLLLVAIQCSSLLIPRYHVFKVLNVLKFIVWRSWNVVKTRFMRMKVATRNKKSDFHIDHPARQQARHKNRYVPYNKNLGIWASIKRFVLMKRKPLYVPPHKRSPGPLSGLFKSADIRTKSDSHETTRVWKAGSQKCDDGRVSWRESSAKHSERLDDDIGLKPLSANMTRRLDILVEGNERIQGRARKGLDFNRTSNDLSILSPTAPPFLPRAQAGTNSQVKFYE